MKRWGDLSPLDIARYYENGIFLEDFTEAYGTLCTPTHTRWWASNVRVRIQPCPKTTLIERVLWSYSDYFDTTLRPENYGVQYGRPKWYDVNEEV